MSLLERRGRLFFLILATLVVLDRVSSIAIALTGDTQNFSLLRAVFWPMMVIFGVVSLWRGETWLRWLLTVCSLIHGGTNLLILAFMVYRLVAITPPEQTGVFLITSVMIFGLPLLYAGFYLFIGLALIFSRSLKSFFDHQIETAENPFVALMDWILSFAKLDHSSRSFRKFFHEYKNRTRYPVLTADVLESLDDFELVDAVVDYVRLKVDVDFENEFEIVSSLPRGFQAVYSTWWVQAEVCNGGFHQFFYNRGADWAFMALEGYKFFGANELAELMTRGISIFLQEEPEQIKRRTNDPSQFVEQYVKARDISTLPELDDLFYKIENIELAAEYITAHINEFVAE